MKQPVYLDFAAATPLDPGVEAAMLPYSAKDFYNPSATYLAARQSRQALEAARAETAVALGAKPSEIIFTAGATEANNLAIQGLLRQYPHGKVLVTAIEHKSVLEPAKLFNHSLIPVGKDGLIDLNRLENLIDEKLVLLSVGYVNNEIGVLQPLRGVAELVKRVRQQRQASGNKLPIFLHSDAAQAPSFFDLQVARLGVDLLSLNGSKIYGPKQTGLLYKSVDVRLQPLILGGGQEHGLRSGTENLAGFLGLAKALSLAGQKRSREKARLSKLRQEFLADLASKIPPSFVNGSAKHSAPHIVSLTLPGLDNERLMMQLDEAGWQVAVGSACSAVDEEPSHVLKAVGLSEAQARSTLRISFGRTTTADQLQAFVSALQKLL